MDGLNAILNIKVLLYQQHHSKPSTILFHLQSIAYRQVMDLQVPNFEFIKYIIEKHMYL